MNKGFTLMETVIVVGIFGVLMLAGTDFFIQIVQNSNRTTIENEVHQNANQILQDLSTSIRASSCVSWVGGNNSDILLTTYLDGNCATPVDTFQFVFDPNQAKKLNSGKVFKNGQRISSNGVAAINCAGASECATSWAGCVNGFSVSGTSGTNQAVTIGLVVQATTSATRSDFCAVVNLSDTITPRTQF